ncbi:MAG: hypothetical protein ACRD1R_04840 [Acidobacteriota bacterium]
MLTTKRPICFLLSAAFTVLLSACGSGEPNAEEKQALLEDFEETMTGATLVGYFTSGEGKLSEERYTIEGVNHLGGDFWLFRARIRYGERDITLPVPLQVKWAGNTPVLTLTDVFLPGLGTFTARVLIYRGEYAGTWSGGDHGGQMFGRIEKSNE